MRDKFIEIIALAFFIIYFFFNIFILSHYGVTWDEAEHYQRGQVYLQYFLREDKNSFYNNKGRLSVYQNYQLGKEWRDLSYFFESDAGHPPLNGILAAVSSRIFYQSFGILGDIESYHFFIVLVSVLLTGVVFFWTKKIYGPFAGVVALLSIAVYPLFAGESHFNIKDPIEASFYTAALVFFFQGITKNNWKWIILSSIFSGLALGTKFNILFAFFGVVPWIIIYKWNVIEHLKWPFSPSVSKALLTYLFIPLGILYVTWPFLWQNPLVNLLKTFSYYKEIGASVSYQPTEYLLFGKINIFAIQWIFFTTPIIILFLCLIGIFYSLTKGYKEKNKTSLFILFWLLVPILRVSMPNAGIYGGVRQIMEYIPAMAILAGIGANYIVSLLHCFIVKYKKGLGIRTIEQLSNRTIKFAIQLLFILAFLPITIKLISIHPNENVYFNPLIGGLKGAKERNIMYWGYNLGNVFRQAAVWLNQNAEKNSKVTRGTAFEDLIKNAWLRKDIQYSYNFKSGFEKKGEYIIEFTHDMPVWPRYYYFNYAKTILEPVHEIKIDDIQILTIWKNDLKHTKDQFKSKEEAMNIYNYEKGKNYIQIDLQEEVLLTELNIFFSNSNCYFTSDGYIVTKDDKGNWTNHPGNLGELAFYPNFNPRKNRNVFSYLFPAEKTRLIKIIHSENNNCFEDFKSVNIKRIPL